jgi:enoyl-CoA hydratase/carnithine racemase
MPDIRVEQEGRVLVLVVDQAQARNALAASTMEELDAHLREPGRTRSTGRWPRRWRGTGG